MRTPGFAVRSILAALLVSLAGPGAWHPALATTYLVTDLGDGTQGSLRQAIASSTTGDTIRIAPSLVGTITLTSGSLTLTHDLVILGTQNRLVTISGNDTYGIFFVPVFANIKITQLTMAHSYGLALQNLANLTLEDCVLRNNYDVYGPGAISNEGTLTVNRCTIADNVGSGRGGGIFNQGTLTISESTISGNTVNVGTAGDGGGGLATVSSATLVSTTICMNQSFYANLPSNTGGGILVAGGTLDMTNCTITANQSASASGVFVFPEAGPVTCKSTIIAGNGDDVGGQFVSNGYNLIGNMANPSGFGAPSHDLVGTPGFPINPYLGALQDNGGPTWTCMPEQGFSLAIDQGKSPFLTDQRGHSRRYDYGNMANAEFGDGSDIGACEASPTTTWPVTNTLDDGPGSLRRAILTAGPGDVVQCTAISAGTITLASGELIVGKGIDIEGLGAKLSTVNGGGQRPDILFLGGYSTMRGFTFTGAGAVNGCVYVGPATTAGLDQIVVSHNPCAGVFNDGTLWATRCAFVQNNANRSVGVAGGGLCNRSGALLVNCTIASDSSRWGGGIDNISGTVTLQDCTVSGNVAVFAGTPSRIGGGIYNESGSVSLTSTIAAGNTAISGGPDVLGAFNTGGYNLIGKADGSTGFANGVGHDQVGSIAAPINPLLGALGDNGGQTPTLLPQAGSPVIDAGYEPVEVTDQRCGPRIYDDPSVANASDGADIGACEVENYAVSVSPSPQTVLRFAPIAPNPARGAASFSFATASAGKVDLAVFDASGRLVRSLASGLEPAGEHLARWEGITASGDRAPTGIYWVRLSAGGRTVTRSFVWIRE